MGRFKRHRRSNTTTTTVTATPVIFPKAKKVEEVKPAEISERCKQLMTEKDYYSYVPYKDRHKGFLISSLIRNLSYSLKKRGLYSHLLVNYVIDRSVWDNDIILAMDTEAKNRFYAKKLSIGKDVVYCGKSPYYSYPLSAQIDVLKLYKSLLGRLYLLDTLLIHSRYAKSRALGKEMILRNYAEDELLKLRTKVYPNELVFGFLFGTISCIIGILFILYIMYSLLGMLCTVIFFSIISFCMCMSFKDN